MKEPQSRIIINWITSVIVIPLFILCILVAIIYLLGTACPYTEDVSSCFPWSLPDWVKILLPFLIILIVFILLFLIKSIRNLPEK